MRPLLLLLLAGSCSWAFVRAPASTSLTEERPDCTTSRVAPGLDTGVSAGAAAATVILNLTLPCNGNGELCGLGQAMLFAAGALVVIPYGLSALYGWERVNRCHQLVEIYDNAHPTAAPAPAPPPPVAAPARLPGPGERCAHALPGAPHSGVCRRGLLCRDGTCVEVP